MSFNHKQIEKKWRKKWRESGVYKVDMSIRQAQDKKKFYNLMMFPYPSAEGLHVGNMYAFTGADFYGRFKAMRGYEVFEPIGLDGFGIHSENYAIKIGKHPAEQAKISEKRYYGQLERIGNRFSWENKLETYDPEYYKWTQWLFIKMFEKGLAYRKKSLVNWCPSCKTVLADEQVEGGVCERCKNEAEKKETEQWFFKITDYAQRLLDNIKKIDWPEKIKTAQKNWIGRKQGINISYSIKSTQKKVVCFTTRPDTNFGASFIVIGPEHSLITQITNNKLQTNSKSQITNDKRKEIKEYVGKAIKKSEVDRLAEGKKKTGVFTGLYAINELNGKELPIWISDFVLGHVGTGAVIGVPGHDKRDFEFAKEFDLEIIRVVIGKDGDKSKITKIEQVQEAEGKMINSEFLNGMDINKAVGEMMDYLEKKGMGKRVVTYKLRDWCISRQRYWGPPIPMIFCKECARGNTPGSNQVAPRGASHSQAGWYPVEEKDLPVKLPYVKDYKPTGEGKSPLEKADKEWLEVDCPKCGSKAKRETDVSDTFLDSSWYFLRYPSVSHSHSRSDKSHSGSVMKALPWNLDVTKKWLPVDAYIAGAEHAVLHLMYSRFVWMALRDWGYLGPKKATPGSKQVPPRGGNWEEPFPFLYGHGLIIKDGFKMSKSRGNVVIPDEYIDKYGADALRMYLMFIGPFDQGGDFVDTGMVGMFRFLNRVWKLVIAPRGAITGGIAPRGVRRLRHKTVKKVTEAMEKLKYNVGIAGLMEYVNVLVKLNLPAGGRNTNTPGSNQVAPRGVSREWEEAIKALVLMLAPMAPYMAEDLWQNLQKSEARNSKNETPRGVNKLQTRIAKFEKQNSVHEQEWPNYSDELAKGEDVVVVVQVNGKLRSRLNFNREEAKNKEKVIEVVKKDEKIKGYIIGKKVVKEIFVPEKLVNLVVK